MADALVEDEFDRHPRIRAGKDGDKGLLLVDGILLEDGQIFIERGQLAGDEALVDRRSAPSAACSGVIVDWACALCANGIEGRPPESIRPQHRRERGASIRDEKVSLVALTADSSIGLQASASAAASRHRRVMWQSHNSFLELDV